MKNLLELNSIDLGYPVKDQFKSVISQLSLDLATGEIGALLGPSGCGKTTVLRAIAGFEPVYRGEIRLAGNVISDQQRFIPPEDRQIGMMFQDYALFPHLSIQKNIAFGLNKLAKSEAQRITAEMLNLIDLTHEAKSYPHELSGGQQQRVALARAIAAEPKLVLLDEPFSNLDVDTREKLALEIRRILKAKNLSAMLVTHNQTEAFAFADKIGIINKGRLVQWAPAQELIQQPACPFVSEYIRADVVAAFLEMQCD